MDHIDNRTYLKSLGIESLGSIISGQNFFKGMSSSGKSGSFFFTSSNDQFFVKTISDKEFEVACEMLGVYINFLNSKRDDKGQTNTLISK